MRLRPRWIEFEKNELDLPTASGKQVTDLRSFHLGGQEGPQPTGLHALAVTLILTSDIFNEKYLDVVSFAAKHLDRQTNLLIVVQELPKIIH